MKSILMILTNGFEPDVRVYKEAKYLVDKGCAVTILCWDRDCNDEFPSKETMDGIDLIRYKIKSQYGTRWKQIGAYLRFLICCKNYTKKNQFDYLHCHDIDGAAIGCCIKKSKKMIFDMHEFYEHGNSLIRWFWRRITIFLLKSSYAGIYVTRLYLDNKYKAVREKLFELRNYPDASLIKPLNKTDSNCFRIGYHGVVRNQIADFHALFDAVKEMQDCRVDINGGGNDLRELQHLKQNYDNIYVHGPYDGINKSSELYANTDLLFVPYPVDDPNYQGDTEVIKFYEAIFTGTPMLITHGIGMEEKVIEKKFGVSCDTRDPEAIKKKIQFLMSNRNVLEIFRKNELQHAHEYSWNDAVTVLDKIYNL